MNLTEAWTAASAALPLEWELQGVMRGWVWTRAWHHDMWDFPISGPLAPSGWVAVAWHPLTLELETGEGETASSALIALARDLVDRRSQSG
jgi:hypothetical protein